MLKKVRVTLAIIFFVFLTLLFLDFTGILHTYFGWMAKLQFIPALLSLNVIALLILIILTLFFGRIYCSVICPLGIFQDIFSNIASRVKKNRFNYSKAIPWLRYSILILFIAALFIHISFVSSLLEPYSAYGRIVSNLLAPVYLWINNLFANLAERIDSYAFYTVDVWIKGGVSLIVAIITVVIVVFLALRNGRIYCNSICPVGTLLGFLSKFSFFKVRITTDKCNGCGLCERNCKASCIDSKLHQIDYSRCVGCMNCIEKCNRNAIRFSLSKTNMQQAVAATNEKTTSRRQFLALSSLFALTIIKTKAQKVDGGLAFVENKKIPQRNQTILPFGSLNERHFNTHCTACQLCISVCPNQVLRPSTKLTHLMQPEMSYERGFCRPECTRCSEICPTGAIKRIDITEKSSIKIGTAKFIKNNCVVFNDEVSCGNCARHCPVGAIEMVAIHVSDENSRKFPVVNEERCIGCGACEYICPSRPFSAIYVEGIKNHRII